MYKDALPVVPIAIQPRKLLVPAPFAVVDTLVVELVFTISTLSTVPEAVYKEIDGAVRLVTWNTQGNGDTSLLGEYAGITNQPTVVLVAGTTSMLYDFS